jgi:hypothetical protein
MGKKVEKKKKMKQQELKTDKEKGTGNKKETRRQGRRWC